MTLYIEQAARPTATAAPAAAAEFARRVARATAADRTEADYGLANLENGTFFCRRLAEGHDNER